MIGNFLGRYLRGFRLRGRNLGSGIRNCKGVLWALIATCAVLWPSAARAQSCALCYNAAAAAKATAIQALRHGILILLLPPLAMFIGIFAVAFRRSNSFSSEQAEEGDEDQELRELASSLSAGASLNRGDLPAERSEAPRSVLK
jgi:hypothetical protein